MILNCHNCGGSLYYDPESNKLQCGHCRTAYELSEYDGEDAGEEEMEAKTCVCEACGGRLIMNSREVASFCVFCGQPTIVPERISRMKRPKYIVPFSVSKERAYDIIKKRFRKSRYIAKEFKNIEPGAIRPVYIPFMRYGVNYRDWQLIEVSRGSGSGRYSVFFYRGASCDFPNVTVDASFKLNDESSQRLEPYDLSKLLPFHIGHLSGYYAFGMDENSAKMEEIAIARCKELFDDEMLKTVLASEKEICGSHPAAEITSKEYIMLPVWLAVFRIEGKAYTIMVNGQTGKMVGAMPFDERKVKQYIRIYSAIFSPVLSALMTFAIWYIDSLKLVFCLALVFALLILSLHERLKAKCMEYGLGRRLANAFSIREMAGDERRD